MKGSKNKFVALVSLLLCFVLFLSGCVGTKATYTADNITVKDNYNNVITTALNDFCPKEDKIYYVSSGVWNSGIYRADGETNECVISDAELESDFTFEYDLQVFENDIYFWTSNFDYDKFVLYAYNTNTEELTKCLTVNDVYGAWTVFNGVIIFTTMSDGAGMYDLWYTSPGGTPTKIADNAEAFGIAGDQIRYVLNDYGSKNYRVYSHDIDTDTSLALCEFDYNSNDPCLCFNFTDDQVIFYDESDADVVNVYTISSDALTSYEVAGEVRSISCFENYAFLAIGNGEADLFSEEDNVETEACEIYRMDLSSGNTERISDKKVLTNSVYAVNEDQALVSVFNEDYLTTTIALADASGSLEKVFEFE